MDDLYQYVGDRIRELRTKYAGTGIPQEGLAKVVGVTPNTISRWETAVYKPDLADLEKLARFFAVSILDLLPPEQKPEDERVAALLRAAKRLPEKDLEELQRYAEFRRARHLLSQRETKGGPKRANGA